MYNVMLGALFLLCSISSAFAACAQGEISCGNGCMPLGAVCCDTKTHYCATRETCSTANGTAVCVQGCLVGSAQGSQECGTGCIQIGNVCCGSNSTKFWSCGQGGRCDTANSACFAFGTNAQEPGGEVNSKITTQAKPVESGQSPSQSSAGSGPSATSPVSGNPGGSGNPNSGEGLGTFGIILIVVAAVVNTLLAGMVGFMCSGYKKRISKIEKVLPKPLGNQPATNVPMYPPVAS